jgi:hypothetical protein
MWPCSMLQHLKLFPKLGRIAGSAHTTCSDNNININSTKNNSTIMPQEIDAASLQTTDQGTEKNNPLSLDIDVCYDDDEDQNYDDLLDELLSDGAGPSPNTELLDTESTTASPTFHSFWATINDDDDDVDCYEEEEDKDYNVNDDIENLAQLIHTLDDVSRRGIKSSRLEPPPEKHNDNSPSKKTTRPCRVSSSPRPAFSPSQRTAMFVLPKESTPSLDDRFLQRRVSTGSILEPISQLQERGPAATDATAVLKEQEVNYHDQQTRLTDDVDNAITTATTEASTKASQSTETMTNSSKHEDSHNNINDVMVMAYSIDSLDLKPSASTTPTAASLSIQETKTMDTDISEENHNDADPYEWAYNVWKRLGLMAGTPTDHGKPTGGGQETYPLITTAPSTESSQASRKSESTRGGRASHISVARLREPKDRQSFPAKMSSSQQNSSYPAAQKKTRNTAGFSILLSKWKDKSEGNSHTHYLSPRALSPVLSPKGLTSNKDILRSPTARLTAALATTAAYNRGASLQACNQLKEVPAVHPNQLTSDTTPILSPCISQIIHTEPKEALEQRSANLNHMLPLSERTRESDSSKYEVAEKQSTKPSPTLLFRSRESDANNDAVLKASIETRPVLSPRKATASLEPNATKPESSSSQPQPSGSHQEQQNKGTDPAQWPTPSKNKNALARFLQRSKPTPIKQPIVKSFGEKSRESRKKAELDAAAQEAPQQDSVNLLHDITQSVNRKDRPSRRSLSPKSTVSFLTPGDDTLLEPRDVMSHRHQGSDVSYSSKSIQRTTMSLPVPCQEIFVLYDDQASIGLQSDDMRSMAGESEYIRSVDHRMHFTNMHNILESRVDSMSFDSQSHNTHITFRTETLRTLDQKVNEIKQTTTESETKAMDSKDLNASSDDMIEEMGDITGAVPVYSERPWRKDLLVRNVTTVIERARASTCDCEYSLAMFSENNDDEMVDFFLPLMAVTCSCRKSKKLVNPEDPNSLENILRPWQTSFLKAFGIVKGDQLVKAHHRSARQVNLTQQSHGVLRKLV